VSAYRLDIPLHYAFDRGSRILRVFAVGHRRTIYEEVAASVRARGL